ncbi:MAG TPA: two-component system response regulator NarL [Candidatus Competibacteraceae bacterium]|nr:two-component system response regulator NarL [Candidatus Competibacteraceae bacterium]
MSESVQSVLLIDDHPLLRQGVRQLLALEPSLRVAGEAGSGREGLELARRLQPDLILLDLNMPDMDGLAVLAAIREAELDSRIIVYTVSDQEDDVVRALRAGADGYLLKDMPPLEMLDSIRAVARGQIALSERLTALLAHALRQEGRATAAPKAELTEREREILALIAEGRSNKLIARELNIAEGTVKVHIKHILKKLDLSSRVEAAVWAVKHGYRRKG